MIHPSLSPVFRHLHVRRIVLQRELSQDLNASADESIPAQIWTWGNFKVGRPSDVCSKKIYIYISLSLSLAVNYNISLITNLNSSAILGRFPLIKGRDNPTRQFLPIMSTKCCSGDGEGRKNKGGGGGSRSKTKLCVTKLYVKDGVWQRKMVCVTKLCVKDGLCERCVWKMVWWKMVCERWCVTKWCVKDGVAQDGVWQSCVWKMVWWKMVCDKVVCERWCGERWCVTKWYIFQLLMSLLHGELWDLRRQSTSMRFSQWFCREAFWIAKLIDDWLSKKWASHFLLLS